MALGHPKDTTIQGCSSALRKTAQGSGPSERAGPTPMDTEGRLYRSLRHGSLPMAVLRGRVGLSLSCPDSLAPPTHLLRVNYSSSILPWWLRRQSICLQCRRPGFKPWAGKISWRRKWHPIPVFFPGKSHGRRSLVGYSPWGHKESDTTSLSLPLYSFSTVCDGSDHSFLAPWAALPGRVLLTNCNWTQV